MNYFLFARPSFQTGPAYILDFGNTLLEYNLSETPEQADYFAIKSDWITVGEDLIRAVNAVDLNLPEEELSTA